MFMYTVCLAGYSISFISIVLLKHNDNISFLFFFPSNKEKKCWAFIPSNCGFTLLGIHHVITK